jgi:glycosyltransferase involved in cell wall biosynthesis
VKILFDGHIFASQRYGGVSRYNLELANALFSLGADISILSPLFVNEYLRNSRPPFLDGNFFPYVPHTGFLRRFTNTLLSNLLLYRGYREVDLIHETYYSRCRLRSLGSLHVLTVYDMIHELYPEFFSKLDQTRFLKRKSVSRASLLICISKNTKQDFLRFFPDFKGRLEVVYPGFRSTQVVASQHLGTDMGIANEFRTSSPYILFVGQRKGYKNFSNLLKAFGKSNFLRKNISILCFGGGLPSESEKELIFRLGLTRNVRFTSGNDESLMKSYGSALAFVYPSLYEGFGIPPLEAMSMGCPVICSRTSSIPEVVGEAGAYFDPSDIDDISNQIENVICSSGLREKLIDRGKARYPIFSWGNCAEKTLSLYESVLEG